MWPDRRLCDVLKIEHPIIQAPMAGSATPELAAAVSNAGGLGSLGCAMMKKEDLLAAVRAVRARTTRPFNLNFFVHPQPGASGTVLAETIARLSPYYEELRIGAPPAALPPMGPGFDEARLALVLEIKPPVVSFHFGIPDQDAIGRLKDAGIVLLSTATTVAEARKLAAGGMDGVIAQGWEAGGHRGSHHPPIRVTGSERCRSCRKLSMPSSSPSLPPAVSATAEGLPQPLRLAQVAFRSAPAFCPVRKQAPMPSAAS